MRNTNKGFTLPELLIVIWAIGGLVIVGLVVYTAIHFIMKVW